MRNTSLSTVPLQTIRIAIFLDNYFSEQAIFHNSYLQKQPPEVFYKKAVLKNHAIFTEKHLHWSPFLIKLQA